MSQRPKLNVSFVPRRQPRFHYIQSGRNCTLNLQERVTENGPDIVEYFQGVFRRKYQKQKLSKKSCEEKYSDSIVTLFHGKELLEDDSDSDNYSTSFKLLFNRSELSGNKDVVALSSSDSKENVIQDTTSLIFNASLPSLPTISSDTSVVECIPSLPSILLPSLPTITCTSIPKKKDSRQTSLYLQTLGSSNLTVYESGNSKKIKYEPTTRQYIDPSTNTGVGRGSTFINRDPLCPLQKPAQKKKAPSVYRNRRKFIRTLTNHNKTKDFCKDRVDDYLADDEQSLVSQLSNLALLK